MPILGGDGTPIISQAGGAPGPDSVGSEEVRDDSLELADLSPTARAAIESGEVPTTFTAASELSIATTGDQFIELRGRALADDGSVRWFGSLRLYHHDGMGASVAIDLDPMSASDATIFGTPTASGTGSSTVITLPLSTVASGSFLFTRV